MLRGETKGPAAAAGIALTPAAASACMTPQGLTQREAAERLAAEGANDLPVAGRRTAWKILADIVAEPMFAFLLAAGAVYLLLGDLRESILMFVFASLSVTITAVQEVRGERVLEALRDLTSPRALVVRDGKPLRIPGRDVVRGDLIVVGEGDRVPADAVILSGDHIMTDESLLTGESAAVSKKPSPAPLAAAARPGGEGLPFIYAGSLVVRGDGRALVVATGSRSEIGKIGLALSSIEAEQPRLRRQTRDIVRLFAFGALLFTGAVVVLNGFLYGDWLKAFLGGIALGMSLLPEEFPLVLAVFTVMGAWRISKARVLTRRAAAIETLGAATVLCTDKTGTLTRNKMSIVRLWRPGAAWGEGKTASLSHELRECLQAGVLASRRESYDPMDMAFYDMARSHAVDAGAQASLHHYGLRADLLAMGNLYACATHGLIAVKGAPEAILQLCRPGPDRRREVEAAMDEMAQAGMRVLGVAQTCLPPGQRPDDLKGLSFEFLGLAGFADPLRDGVPQAVREAQAAGIRVVMITGDYPLTAQAIALQAGIPSSEVLTGKMLESMTERELGDAAMRVSVFSRILPEQKLRIVNALKARGQVVAMTGDGVNDAPSLKAAHIGIAMGGRGTDVAREASSIVLLDDDFNSLVKTIRLGRRIYDNIRKAFLYIIAVHVPIAGVAILPVLFGWPLILTPLLIALMEMVIDPACSIVLEAEREEGDIMARPPRNPAAPIFSLPVLSLGVVQGICALAMTAGVLYLSHRKGLPQDEMRSLVFTTLVMVNLALIFANRSFSASPLSALTRPNPLLWRGLGAVLLVLGVVVFWPVTRGSFGLGPLHAVDAWTAFGTGAATLILIEGIKFLWRRWL